MDILYLISFCSAIYLLWFYNRKRKLKKALSSMKQPEKQPEKASDDKILFEQNLVKWEVIDGKKTAIYIYKESAYLAETQFKMGDAIKNGLYIKPPKQEAFLLKREDGDLILCNKSVLAMKGDHLAIHITEEERKQRELEKKKKDELARIERAKREEEREKREIAEKLKKKQRKRELEKIVTQELIDKGELFGDQPKRPPIPREVVDAVYSRDKGVCVYCGSTDNLQLDHIIPFSKGGATTIENLQLLCQKCNLEKSNHIG